jgi:hypothetical protein
VIIFLIVVLASKLHLQFTQMAKALIVEVLVIADASAAGAVPVPGRVGARPGVVEVDAAAAPPAPCRRERRHNDVGAIQGSH